MYNIVSARNRGGEGGEGSNATLGFVVAPRPVTDSLAGDCAMNNDPYKCVVACDVRPSYSGDSGNRASPYMSC